MQNTGGMQCKACLSELWLLQKRLRLRLLWWSGFSGGAGAVLENVWQNGFTYWVEVVKYLNYPSLYFSLIFFFPFSFSFSSFFPLLFFFSPSSFFSSSPPYPVARSSPSSLRLIRPLPPLAPPPSRPPLAPPPSRPPPELPPASARSAASRRPPAPPAPEPW